MSVISDRVRVAKDLTELTMYVKEWDVTLLCISPTVAERIAMMEQYTTWETDVDGNREANLDLVKMAPSLVIACAYDPETREPAFEDADMVMLEGKNGAVVQRIAEDCFPLVGFSKKSETATDAPKGTSSTTPTAAIASASPAISDDH